MPSRGTRVVQRVIGVRGGDFEAVHSRYTCKRACRRQQCGSISGRLFASIDIIDRSNERQSVSWKRVCKFLHPSCFLPSFLPLLPPQLLIAVQSFLEHRLYHRAIFRLGPFTIDRDKRVHRNLSSFLSSRISSLSDRKQKLNIYDINGSLENGLPCVDPYTLVSFPHPTGIR